MVINAPLIDLRAQPHTTAQLNLHDPLEETQLLYGERVRVLTRKDGWARVEAIEQPEFTHATRWQGYPGWIAESALAPWEPLRSPTIVITEKWAPTWLDPYLTISSPWRFALGTRLRATDMGGARWKIELSDGKIVWMPHRFASSAQELIALGPTERRRMILRNAALFLGDPYYWGGRSPHSADLANQVTGVDCSGLVHLAYRAAGLDIPRDAHEQFLRAKPTKFLQPADLIFLSAHDNQTRIVHVMLYAGDGMVIEGPGTGLRVRNIAIAERLGQPREDLRPSSTIDGQTVSFGAYVP